MSGLRGLGGGMALRWESIHLSETGDGPTIVLETHRMWCGILNSTLGNVTLRPPAGEK
jgi:hypothetical protein